MDSYKAQSMDSEKITPDSLLEHHGVRPTPARILCLRQLLSADSPISALEIETEIDTLDRSSITRTLRLFLQKGLIHAISDGSGAVRFEVCKSSTGHSPSDEHIHFHCMKCGHTECLSDIAVPEVTLPEGYKLSSVNYVASGLCASCSREADSGNSNDDR